MTSTRSTVVVRRATRSDVGTLVDLMRQLYAEPSHSLALELYRSFGLAPFRDSRALLHGAVAA